MRFFLIALLLAGVGCRTSQESKTTEEESELRDLARAETRMVFDLCRHSVERGDYASVVESLELVPKWNSGEDLLQPARRGLACVRMLLAVDHLVKGETDRAAAELAKAPTDESNGATIEQLRQVVALSKDAETERSVAGKEYGGMVAKAGELLEAGNLDIAEPMIWKVVLQANRSKQAFELLRLLLRARFKQIVPDSSPRVKPTGNTRPITKADTILAIFLEDWRWASQGNRLIVAIWGDGKAVWSENRFAGGPPFRSADVDREQLNALLERMEKDGHFDKKRSQARMGPDSLFTSMLVRSGKQRLQLSTWHELSEPYGMKGTSNGLVFPNEEKRLDVLEKEPAEFLFFRFLWSETRTMITSLIPDDGTPHEGVLWQEAGEMSWIELESK